MSRTSPRPRLAPFLLLGGGAAVVIALLVAGLTGSFGQRQETDPNDQTAATAAAATTEPCNIRDIELHCTEMRSGGKMVSTSPISEGTKQIVVIDQGGPGADLRTNIEILPALSQQLNDSAALNPSSSSTSTNADTDLQDKNSTTILTFQEPWFEPEAVTNTCQDAASTFQAKSRATPQTLIKDLRIVQTTSASQQTKTEATAVANTWFRDSCNDEIKKAASFVAQRTQILASLPPEAEVVYLGWSFASVRLMQLAEEIDFDSVMLFSPIPTTPDLDSLLATRAAKADDLLRSYIQQTCTTVSCSDAPDSRPATNGNASNQLLDMTFEEPLPLEGRSVDLTAYDIAASIYAASYDFEANSRWLLPGLESLAQQESDPSRIAPLGAAADQVTGRYGVSSVYPGIIGYWAEFCTAFNQPEVTLEQQAAPAIEWFLTQFHLPCHEIARQPQTPKAKTTLGDTPVCAVIGEFDPLAADPDEISKWAEAPPVVLTLPTGHTLGIDDERVSNLIDNFITEKDPQCGL